MSDDCLMPTSVGEVVELSEKMSGSQFCRQKGLVREADCLAVLLAGNCLGLSPIESVQLVSIRDCDVVVGISVLIKMAQKQPDYMDLFWINTDESGATAQLNRDGVEPIRESYSWEDARDDGLTELQSFERRGVLMMKGMATEKVIRKAYPSMCKGLLTELQHILSTRPEHD